MSIASRARGIKHPNNKGRARIGRGYTNIYSKHALNIVNTSKGTVAYAVGDRGQHLKTGENNALL